MSLPKDKWQYIGGRVEADEAEKFTNSVGKNRVSLVLRELVKKFNKGEIVIEIKETITGGA
jgi:hypothetical protein